MRSVDTHIAFSTGARKQVLTVGCKRKFLGDLSRYDTLPEGADEVIRTNFALFDRWAGSYKEEGNVGSDDSPSSLG